MNKQIISVVTVLLVGIATQVEALTYTDRSSEYSDAPFSISQTAGISVLTNLGAIEGNPNGSYAPNRTLNRAEFLKIVLRSAPTVSSSMSDADDCFPDIQKDQWFSEYVCSAKKNGIVSGYPDGNFKPANTVNYAEALKILSEVYDYSVAIESDSIWYQKYADAARARGTALPVNIEYSALLTRGQMARLAAAYRAEYENELDIYRESERGIYPVSSSYSSISSESSISSQTSSVSFTATGSSSSSQELVVTQKEAVPEVQSSLLILGSKNAPIAEASFVTKEEQSSVILVKIRLDREYKSLSSLALVDNFGEKVVDLIPDPTNSDPSWWRGDMAQNPSLLSGSTVHRFLVSADLHQNTAGGIPGELVRVREFKITFKNTAGVTSYEVIGNNSIYPQHQTAQGKIAEVTSTSTASGSISALPDQELASFAVTASGKSISIKKFIFTLTGTPYIEVEDVTLKATGSVDSVPCSVGSSSKITCTIVGKQTGTIDSVKTFTLFGTPTGTTQNGMLQVLLQNPGKIGELGAVQWSDGAVDFTWIESDEPIAVGPQKFVQ